ncbi:MAG: DUF2330 domain-containing protein, partial [Planctomycetota bacterium]
MKSLLILLALCAPALLADPCGMVMPVQIDNGPPSEIKRQGLQKTYVFYKNGIETFAVRPGFTGNVNDFGMLIPVPSMPSIRKIHDDTFSHIAKAIDPPTVSIYSGHEGYGGRLSYSRAAGGGSAGHMGESSIRLLKEEAVGMYQVAVLQAGSAGALKSWMTEKCFVYPVGMEDVCNDYIKADWLFAAIKTRVSGKDRLEPTPGLKNVVPGKGRTDLFQGNVQGLAFRFKTDRLVVPMRLSSYNGSEARNVVYLLTDKPKAVNKIPLSRIKRQISGEQLYLNLTQLLPIEFYDCDINDMSPNRMLAIADRRDPVPHNGIARELFASDILASKSEELEHEFELYEKRLLLISEALELQGPDMDDLHREIVWQHNEADLDTALLDILDMTLTVVDGDFSTQVIRRDNLYFRNYEMPAERNNMRAYSAVSYSKGSAPDGEVWIEL